MPVRRGRHGFLLHSGGRLRGGFGAGFGKKKTNLALVKKIMLTFVKIWKDSWLLTSGNASSQ